MLCKGIVGFFQFHVIVRGVQDRYVRVNSSFQVCKGCHIVTRIIEVFLDLDTSLESESKYFVSKLVRIQRCAEGHAVCGIESKLFMEADNYEDRLGQTQVERARVGVFR